MTQIKTIEFAKDFRSYKKGTKVNINKGLTLITGENGSGKTTLVGCIRALYKKTPWTFSDIGAEEVLVNEPIRESCLYIDLNMDLLRNANEMDYKNINLHVSVLQKSAGEGAALQLFTLMSGATQDLVILDEPERGLSESTQFVVAKFIERFLNKHPDKQVIVNTHSSIIMHVLEPYAPVLVAPEFKEVTAAQYKESCRKRGERMWEMYIPLLDEEDAENSAVADKQH